MDERASTSAVPTLVVDGTWSWDAISAIEPALAAAMAGAIPARRWFGAKSRPIESLEIVDVIGLSPTERLLLARIHFTRGAAEVYQVPLGFADGERARRLEASGAAWIRVESRDGRPLGVLYDALGETDFCRRLLELFESPRTLPAANGELIVAHTSSFDPLVGRLGESLAPRLVAAEQSNSSVIYGERLVLKIFRRLETGLNPDLEISQYLTRRQFRHTPPVAGALEYRPGHEEPWALAMLQAFVPNQGDAWKFTLDWLARLLSAVAADATVPALPGERICRAAEHPLSPEACAAFGEYLASVELLGTRTAELHQALAADAADSDFAPEPFSDADRREYFRRCADEARDTFALLRDRAPRLTGPVGQRARHVAALEGAALERYARLSSNPVVVSKIRCHGDYHLGQVLVADGDFVIIDFEGEPVRSIAERRRKQLALRDVAGMIRSLHYASCSAASAARTGRAQDDERIAGWTRSWYAWSSAAFLAAYRRTAGEAVFLPRAIDEFERLLDGCLLEKAIYELRYELNNRPDWVYLPLAALVELLDGDRRA